MYVELFLIDNIIMNMIILKIAAAFGGKKLKYLKGFAFSAFASIYSAVALAYCKLLLTLPFKILLCFVMGCAICSVKIKNIGSFAKDLMLSSLFVLISTFMVGGLTYALAICAGGSMQGGAIIASIPVRTALISVFIAMSLPQMIRKIRSKKSAKYALIKLEYNGYSCEKEGIIDSGNLLCEPLSGKPVVIVTDDFFKDKGNIVLPYSAIGENGYLMGVKIDNAAIKINDKIGFVPIDVIVAYDDNPKKQGIDAIIPETAIPENLFEQGGKYELFKKNIDSAL